MNGRALLCLIVAAACAAAASSLPPSAGLPFALFGTAAGIAAVLFYRK